MSTPYSLENTLRAHDVAIYDWLGGLHVDYNDSEKGIANKNDIPILRVFASPQRAFATVQDMLIKDGWISGLTPAAQQANAGDFDTLPLPVLTLQRGEPQIDAELSAPAKVFRHKVFDPLTGQFINHQWPGHYKTDYTITLWGLKRYTDNFMREWIMSHFGAAQGVAFSEYMLLVKHADPWGDMRQALRYIGSSDLSDLEGETTRYIRVEFTFSLRTWLFRTPVAGETQANHIGEIIALTKDEYGVTHTETDEYDANPNVDIISGNLFNYPVFGPTITTTWPRTGDARVAPGEIRPGPVNSLYMEIDSPDDSVQLIERILVPDTNGNSVVSIALQYVATEDVDLEVSKRDNLGAVFLAFEKKLPKTAKWTKVHVFAIADGADVLVSIVGRTGASLAKVTIANVDIRHVSTLTPISPVSSAPVGSEIHYTFSPLPGIPYLAVGLLLSTSSPSDTFAVDDDAITPAFTNLQSIDSQVNVGAVALIQPRQSSIVVRVPNTVALASVMLQRYAGAYYGNEI